MFLMSGLALALCAVQPVAAAPQGTRLPAHALDHILLWGRSIDEVSAILSVKLGFQVLPGHDPGGVANRYVRFADQGYVELLGVTRDKPDMDPGMQADQASLKGQPGARSFGIRAAALEKDQARLKGQGLAVTPVFTADTVDPDGPGPKKAPPPRWRLFAFEKQPLAQNLFFIDYAPLPSDPASVADDRAAREHANGARSLSAVWLLSADAKAETEELGRLGGKPGKAVSFPQVGARGWCVALGPQRVLALQPEGPGVAADALKAGGPQILGISVGVSDLPRARRKAERGYETTLTPYAGLMGQAVLAPTQKDLGLLIELHATPRTPPADPCV